MTTPPDFPEIQQRMRAGDFAGALTALGLRLAEHSEDTEALYMRAVAHRYTGDTAAALADLARLKSLAPEHGRAHQEEGHLQRALGQPQRALAAYARACQTNPALEAAWRGQFELLSAAGQDAAAQAVKMRLDDLLALPKPLVTVTDLIAQGRLLKAEDLCRRFMQQHPRNVAGMRLLADIGIRLGVLEDAEFLLESAVAFAPEDVAARIDYIGVLRKRQKFERALAQAQQLLDTDPASPRFQSLFAIECMQTGDYEQALKIFDEVLARIPGDPVTLTSKGHALKTCGRTDEAVSAYREAIATLPRHGEAWYSLANLKTYRFTGEELAGMRAREDDPDLGLMDRVHLNFALGKAHEDAGDYSRAFDAYLRGNGLKKAGSRYDADRMHEEMAATRGLCTAEFFAARQDGGHLAPDPIFILGLPRAGSTLLEQILSSHSQVDGTLELPNILSLSQRLRRREGGGGYPAVLAQITPQEREEFGAAFIEDTRIHRSGAPLFIDKMPNNFRHIGLIQLILPNAKIIDARRHPMACCFSGFKQLFAEGQEFSYDLADIGHYYRDYVELMDHWDLALPGRVLRVQHEALVDDLETEVRRMLDFCGLPFEAACLRYWETERAVRTPSSEQVRRPIFRDSIEQWRNFEPWLAPLEEALGPVLDRYPIT